MNKARATEKSRVASSAAPPESIHGKQLAFHEQISWQRPPVYFPAWQLIG